MLLLLSFYGGALACFLPWFGTFFCLRQSVAESLPTDGIFEFICFARQFFYFFVLFTATLDGLGCVGDGAHADHEHIVIDPSLDRCALLARLLLAPPQEHVAG